MNARFNPQTEGLQILQVGPIGPDLQSFAHATARQGYCDGNRWPKRERSSMRMPSRVWVPSLRRRF